MGTVPPVKQATVYVVRDFILIASCLVYVARNRINGRRYIGATEKGIARRRRTHFWNARTGRPGKFNAAIRKHGETAFEFLPLLACVDFFEALEHERRLIAEMRPEYNLTDGGGGVKGLVMSAAARQKMAAAKLGKAAAWLNGDDRAAIIAKIAQLTRTRPKRAPTEKQIAARNALAPLGNAARRRAILCIADGIRYPSLTAAGGAYGLTTGQIAYYCRTRKQSRRGLAFRYLDHKDGEQRNVLVQPVERGVGPRRV